MTDWQPHEDLTHGGSSPAEDWTEPMVDTSNSSNLTVREMMDDAIHRARADAAGVDASKLVDERVAELEAENERLRAALMPLETSRQRDQLQAALEQERDKSDAARRWAAVCKRAASKFRAWQADTYAELEQERRAVEALAEHIEIACEGFSHGSMSAITVAPGGYMDAAEIAAWARNRAREEGGE